MSYKRLNTRLKGATSSDMDQAINAFEAEGRVLDPVFNPTVNYPESDYVDEIETICKVDTKLGFTFERLNKHQRHAVFHKAKNTILAAMVGSGKTTVLIAKIFHLHFICKVPFDKIVVLTFTNKAAREIKERIAYFLGDIDGQLNKQLRYVGTFHAVARQLLDEHPQLNTLGFTTGFMILDEQEKQELLERVITQEGLTLKYQNKLAKRWKFYQETGSVIMGNMKTDDDLELLIQFAENEKRRINSVDFDDLLTLCNKLQEKNKATVPEWIIVDEFQDCNETQLQLIENLKGEQTSVFVVGDPNQSIYGWRGSKEHIFKEVQAHWDATWMELPQNYRSTGTIVSAAETLLFEKNSSLIATREGGAPVSLVRHFDDQQEAFYLREQMLRMQKENSLLDNVAILFRTHDQIKLVETVFAKAKIGYQLGRRMELYDDVAQTFILRIFKLCLNPNDIDACLAIVCNKNFGILKRNKNLIQKLQSRENDSTVLSAMCQLLRESKKPTKDYLQLLKQVETFISDFLEKRAASSQELIEYLHLQNILKPTSIHYKAYIKSIDEAWNQINDYMNDKGWGSRQEIFHIAVDQVVLEGSFQINKRIKEKGVGVHLLTIHAAKGLEFDKVFIAGANTGIIPLTQHSGSQHLKEEKRLLFVAITRGKNLVEIGWHAQPSFRNALPEPSYFLNAIPQSLLERSVSGASEEKISKNHQTEAWAVHTRIAHKKYGTGVITSLTETDLICSFDGVGEKSFSRAFVKALLVKLD